MDKLKERWEFIVGYVALIVSLSAFKEELTKIDLNLGFLTTSAAQFLFVLILSFLFTMHLYLLPFLLSSTRYANIRFLKLLESLSYFIFVFLSVSPIFILVAVGVNSLVSLVRSIPIETKEAISTSISVFMGVVLGIITMVVAGKYRSQKYAAEKQELEFQEIKGFEIVQKLYIDGYYSQSILEAFKVIQLHLKRLILQKNIPARSTTFQDVLDLALKLGVVSRSESAAIDRIRQMRNSAAHLDADFTKAQASDAISTIRQLIRATSSQTRRPAG